jgi:hypothetical protein
MQRKTWIIAVAIVVLGGAVAGGLYWRWANSPRYALQQAALALQARDMDKFFNYVNLKDILNSFQKLIRIWDLDDHRQTILQVFPAAAQVHHLSKLFEAFQTDGVMERYLLHLDSPRSW